MNHFTILLPCKAYVACYLSTIYGNKTPIIYLDPSTDFGDIIFSKLASHMHCESKPSVIDAQLFRMTATLQLKITAQWFRKLPSKELTRHQIIRINRTLETMFENDLCEVVNRAHDFSGINRQTAIECFAVNHGIALACAGDQQGAADITYEALQKMEYRYRKANARHTVRKKIVRQLSTENRAA